VKVVVLGNALKEGVTVAVERWLPFLRQHAEVLAVDLNQEVDVAQLDNPTLALVFGGDGAILRAAHQMGYHQVPVLGVNLGRLGFLADVLPQELEERFLQVAQGAYRVTQHLMYECLIEIERDGGYETVHTFLGLNEIVVYTIPPMHMLDLHIQVDGVEAAHFYGDGLIISTPIGSTAHNLSAGGPILNQELPAFVLTPICPHALTYRPVVDSADRVYTIRIGRQCENAVLIVDGQENHILHCGERIRLRRAPVDFRLARVPQRGYYETLRDKLRWGTPPNYSGEP
jgi:NAD+ kinase